MILWSKYIKQAEKFATDNSPAILAGVGVVGSVAAVYFTGKASFKASEILAEERNRRFMMNEPDMSTTDKVRHVWKEYLPAAGTLTATVACVICANRISTRRAAAMAVAYSLSERKFNEYRDKIVEKFGVGKTQTATDEIAQETIDTKQPNQQLIIAGNGDVLFFDSPSGRYFKSTMEKVRRIQNDMNQSVITVGYGTLADLYAMLELKPTPWSTELGWDTDCLLEFAFSTALTDDKQPCIVIDHQATPIRGYKQSV